MAFTGFTLETVEAELGVTVHPGRVFPTLAEGVASVEGGEIPLVRAFCGLSGESGSPNGGEFNFHTLTVKPGAGPSSPGSLAAN